LTTRNLGHLGMPARLHLFQPLFSSFQALVGVHGGVPFVFHVYELCHSLL